MKSLLKSLFARKLKQHPDSFALTRNALWKSIAESIKLQQSIGKSVWLVAHFPETYLQCQKMLEHQSLDYRVETETLDETDFLGDEQRDDSTDNQTVRLFLADLLQPIHFESDQPPPSDVCIALMVVERHPAATSNDRLTTFASSLPNRVEVGHFLAMDDEIVRHCVPQEMIELMKTMGLGDNDLVSSTMVTRILRRRINQNKANIDHVVDSAAQWYQQQSQQ